MMMLPYFIGALMLLLAVIAMAACIYAAWLRHGPPTDEER